MTKCMSQEDSLGTEYCPNCVIIAEKMKRLEIWEKTLDKREEELDKEIKFIRENSIYANKPSAWSLSEGFQYFWI